MLSTRQGLLNPVVSTKSTFANGKLITTNGSLPAANSMVDVLGPPQPDIANGVVYIQCQAGSSAIISISSAPRWNACTSPAVA